MKKEEELPFKIGESYFIRTVTYFLVGKLNAIKGNFLIMESASWIADTGRFHQCIKNGDFEEIEPVGEVWLNISSIVDVYPWKHKLPKDQK